MPLSFSREPSLTHSTGNSPDNYVDNHARVQIKGFCPRRPSLMLWPNCGKSPLCSGCFAIRRGLCRCPAYTIIVMLVLYASRKQVELQRACACGDPEIHGGKSSLSAPVVEFTCADPAFLPPSSFGLFFTGADRGFLPPSLNSRVQIQPFCPRRSLFRHYFVHMPTPSQ